MAIHKMLVLGCVVCGEWLGCAGTCSHFNMSVLAFIYLFQVTLGIIVESLDTSKMIHVGGRKRKDGLTLRSLESRFSSVSRFIILKGEVQ